MLRYWPAVLGGLLVLLGLVPAALSADSASSLRDHASQLQQQNATLASRSRGVVLQLYALDSRLAREQARLVELRIRSAQVKADLTAARERLHVARHNLRSEQRSLAARLQLMYEQGDTDPLAVVLGASSVADALGNLDSLDRIATQDRVIIGQARAAKRTADSLTRTLAAKQHDLQALADQASQSVADLQQAHAQRTSYLASLRSQQRLNAQAIGSYQQQALAVEARAREIAATSTTTAASTAPPDLAPGGHTLTVTATGYSMSGRTATGAPTGWGVVAVDPSVIPLGTRLSIPGYGTGVAADTGGAIQGATIDLWFPTPAQARAWGRRTVTISLG
ncbi:MAG TPA: 3D domain-containing protein [Gaiellaceae bacterium]|nr:3D domain-containing protein [Gaiellaceae bacterium]